MPAGDYTGKIIAWSDTDSNEQIGVAEASATADVKITVDLAPKIRIKSNETIPSDLDVIKTPFIMNNSTVNYCFRIYNTGNQDIEVPISVDKNDLTFMTNAITTDDFDFTIDSTLPIHPGEYRLATVTVTLGDTHLVNGNYRGEQTFYVKVGEEILCSDKAILDVEFGKKELLVDPDPLIIDLSVETEGKVHLTRVPPAGITRVCAYEKSHCDRNEPYCDETTISCVPPSPMPVNMGTGSIQTTKDFTFKVNLGPHTAPGLHIATWTFFDDTHVDGNNPMFNEGEYFVDFQIHYIVPEQPRATITPAHLDRVDVAPGETKEIIYTITNTGNTPIDFSDTYWYLPSGLIENEEGKLFNLANLSIASYPVGVLAVEESTTCVIALTCPSDFEDLGIYNLGAPPITQTFMHLGIGLANTTINTIEIVRRGPITPLDTVYQVVATDTFIECYNPENPALTASEPYYFLSAWVCPGLADANNLSSANLSIIRCDESGKPKAALSVRIDNNNLRLESNIDNNYSVFGDVRDGAYTSVGPTSEFTFYPNNTSPYMGISGDPVTAIDADNPTGERLTFYRVYFAFKVNNLIATDTLGNPIEPEHQDKIAILLTQSMGISNTAPTAVYFEGVKLEKAVVPGQDKPTTYSQGTTLVSPSHNLDVSGKHKHYEW